MDAGKACGARYSDREFRLSIYYRPSDRESAKFSDCAMYWGTGNVYANLYRVRERIARVAIEFCP
jgi:hypothetical protein